MRLAGDCTEWRTLENGIFGSIRFDTVHELYQRVFGNSRRNNLNGIGHWPILPRQTATHLQCIEYGSIDVFHRCAGATQWVQGENFVCSMRKIDCGEQWIRGESRIPRKWYGCYFESTPFVSFKNKMSPFSVYFCLFQVLIHRRQRAIIT